MNLVPKNVTLEEHVLSFYNRGKLVRTIKLGDLYKNKSQMEKNCIPLSVGQNHSI